VTPALLRSAYLALCAWQVVWHALLPAPLGARQVWLGLFALLPLLLPLRGLLHLQPRALPWAGFLLVPYFLIGVTETWSNPLQAGPAGVQLALSVACFGLIALVSRQRREQA